MSLAEQKVELFKMIAEADEEFIDALLRKIIDYYTAHPEDIPAKVLQHWAGQHETHFAEEQRTHLWKLVKSRLESYFA